MFFEVRFCEKRVIVCRVTETETEPDGNSDKVIESFLALLFLYVNYT